MWLCPPFLGLHHLPLPTSPPHVKNYDAAAEMYIKAKKYDRAIAILARHAWWDKLISVVRALDKSDSRCLGMCAGHFRKNGQYLFAKETLLKMDDTKVGGRAVGLGSRVRVTHARQGEGPGGQGCRGQGV